jgi:hypothetical protein
MQSRLFNPWLLALAIALSTPASAQPLSDELLALHWHPATSDQARSRTLAAAAWLERDTAEEGWRGALDAIVLRMERSLEHAGPRPVSPVDGTLAWLVRQQEFNLRDASAAFPEPDPAGIGELMQSDRAAGRLARLHSAVHWQAPNIWQRVAERIGEDAVESIRDWWSPLLSQRSTMAEADGDPAGSYARAQAGRVRQLSATQGPAEQAAIRDSVLRAEADFTWRNGLVLDAVWLSFEALLRLTQVDEPAELAGGWQDWLEQLDADRLRETRLIDLDLPLILALLGDAAAYMASPEAAVDAALDELADVYARLALFAPDLAFYLDQPVRQPVRRAIADCNPDPLLIGPLPREVFERCARNLEALLQDGLASDELVGGAQGPFAAEFLRRELGLVSWQRAAYLDGHLDWLVQAQCQSPAWINMMEWSLLVDHLVRWIGQRPVYFGGSRWQATLDGITARMRELGRAHVEWLDCITGQGSVRRDPVMRLLDRHRDALTEVAALLAEAGRAFYESVTRPGADIDLAGPADQVTAYRPEGLEIGPCPEAKTCGARVSLPVSRALLGMFPNAFLLGDQIGLGELDLCYEGVRWVDRRATPTRRSTSRVADYHGRLSFDLVGTFGRENGPQTVFRYRLTDSESRHYLFAAESEDTLALDCPQELIGQSIASQLADDHPGLVPNRLTYFASAPTTPEAQLAANWGAGAEWRDWFVTGRRVERLEAVDGSALETEVQARLAALSARRERQLSAPLINPARAGESESLALAMARASDSAALIRRSLELHYPRIIRQHAAVRAMLAGEAGLVTRDRVRLMRESGVPVARMPQLGLDRVDQLTRAWLALPEALREQGQRAPEVDYALERLAALKRRMNE